MASSAKGKRSHFTSPPEQNEEDQRLAKRPRTASPLTGNDVSIKAETKPLSSRTEPPTVPHQGESESQATLGEDSEDAGSQTTSDEDEDEDNPQAHLESALEWLSDDYAKYLLAEFAREMPEIAQRIREMWYHQGKEEERMWEKELIHGVSLFPDLESRHLEGVRDEIRNMLDKMRWDNAQKYRSCEHKFCILEVMLQIFEAVLAGDERGWANQVCEFCNETCRDSYDDHDEWGSIFANVFGSLTRDERRRLAARPVGGGGTWFRRLDRLVMRTDGHPFLRRLRRIYGIMGHEMP